MSITKGMFTSTTDLWETPQAFFDQLNAEFCFSLDACALPWNAKCERYYTPEQDGLSQIWTGVVWCNPPYGRKIGKWVEKAVASVSEGATVVMLLPARTVHLSPGRDPVCARPTKIWRRQMECTVSVHGCDI